MTFLVPGNVSFVLPASAKPVESQCINSLCCPCFIHTGPMFLSLEFVFVGLHNDLLKSYSEDIHPKHDDIAMTSLMACLATCWVTSWRVIFGTWLTDMLTELLTCWLSAAGSKLQAPDLAGHCSTLRLRHLKPAEQHACGCCWSNDRTWKRKKDRWEFEDPLPWIFSLNLFKYWCALKCLTMNRPNGICAKFVTRKVLS